MFKSFLNRFLPPFFCFCRSCLDSRVGLVASPWWLGMPCDWERAFFSSTYSAEGLSSLFSPNLGLDMAVMVNGRG